MLGAGPCGAASIIAKVLDDAGRGVPDAVVQVLPDGGTTLAGAAPDRAVINQNDEAFIPTVVTVRRGGTVVFHNSDRTQHHIYSFSDTRRFELVQKPNDVSAPLAFDKAGIAAIGCNIHDHMVAYVVVTDAPRSAVTGTNGAATLSDLPPGRFTVSVWHPRLRSRTAPSAQAVTVSGPDAVVGFTVTVSPPRRRDPNSLY